MSLRDLFVEIGMDIDSGPLAELNKEIDELTKVVQNSAGNAISDLEKDLNDASKAANVMDDSLTEVVKEANKAGDSVSDLNVELMDLSKIANGSTVATLDKELNSASKAADVASKSVKSVTEEVKKTSGPMGFLKRSMEGLKTAGQAGLSGLSNGFSKIPGLVTNAASKVGGAATRIGSSVTNFVTAPLRGAIGMIKQYAGALGLLSGGALAASGMARLSAIENAQTSLTVMMGNEAKAKGFLDDVLAFAKTTPFAFPDLAETSRNLIAFGMDEAKVVPTLKAIGDAAAATGKGSEGLNQVASAFGDMQIAGNLGMDQINRLQTAGVPALKILANTFGISTDEMKKRISDGSVDSVKAIDQLVEGMQNGTKGLAGETAAMAGIMEKTKENWTGSVDSLKSSISSTMARLIEPIKPHIQTGMAWFGATFSKLPDVVFGAYEKMKPIIDIFKNTLSEAFIRIGEYLVPLKMSFENAFNNIQPIIEPVVSIFKGLWDIIVSLVENVVLPLIPIVQTIITNAFTMLQPIISAVADVFNFLKTIVLFLVEKVIVPMIPVAQSIIQTAFGIINPIIRIAASLFEVVWGVIKFLVEQIVMPLIPVISSTISGMWKIIKPILEGIITVFEGIATAIEWAVGKFKAFAEVVKNFKMPSFGMPKWMGGNGLVQFGSHATGLGRVPYDGYMAELHKNEAVLTATQSNALRSAGMLKGDGTAPTLDLSKSYEPLKSSPSSTTTNNKSSKVQASVNIVVQGSDNPKETARSIKEELEDWFGNLNDVFPVVLEG